MPPLDGITVLDLTRVLSGPYCTMLLADMGARVIKIEQPGKGDDTRAWGPPFLEGESAYFLSINRNKESVTLDFKQPEGRAILDRLIAQSDVAGRELPAGHAGEARPRLRVARATPSAAGLLLDLGLRPDRTAAQEAGLRRGDAGRRRPDEHHRRAPTARRSASASRSPTSCRACSRRTASRWRCSRASAPDAGRWWTSRCSTRWRRC